MTDFAIEDIYPLTPMQQGMLFHAQLSDDEYLYAEQIGCYIHGELNADAFRRAWEHVVMRHSALRTLYILDDDEALQIVTRGISVDWNQLDWRGEKKPVQWDSALAVLRDNDLRQDFDLSEEPPLRFSLVRLGDNCHYFIWRYHHVVHDGWSIPLVFADVQMAYTSLCQGQLPRFPAVQPYSSYIDWLQQQDQAAAAEFWKSYLQGFDSPNQLTRLSNAVQETRSKMHVSGLDQEALDSFCRRHAITLNTLFQAAWGILLSRLSGDTDIVFGATSSGRPPSVPGADRMIGLFINSLPVRFNAVDDRPLTTVLRELMVEQMHCRQHEYFPLMEIQKLSDIPPGSQLFESLLVFENYPDESVLNHAASNIRLEQFNVFGRNNFPLSLIVIPGDSLQFKLSYQSPAIDSGLAQRLPSYLAALIRRMLSAPETAIREFQLEGDIREATLYGKRVQRQHYSIPALFDQAVDANGNAIAIRDEAGVVKYDELRRAAREMAVALRERGIGEGNVVGLNYQRGRELVTAMLAVMYSGAAFVGLPAHTTTVRKQEILDTASATLLLSNQNNDALIGIEVLSPVDLPVKPNAAFQLALPEADQVAYIAFTSGSTGKPKGIIATHDGVANYLQYLIHEHTLGSKDTSLQLADINFDASIRDIWGPLCAGATLLLPSDEQARDINAIAYACEIHGVTFIPSLVPSLLRAIGELETLESPALRRILVSGEKLHRSDVRTAKRVFGEQCVVVNQYGPTECTMTAMFQVAEVLTSDVVPVGLPIDNMRVMVLDEQYRPVARGCTGEVYIAGPGVALGYVGMPEATAAVFVADPYTPDSKMYRTGDLARLLADGGIELLGRNDRMVKLRGRRLELGAVEAALADIEGVLEAAVVVLTEGEQQRLTAFVVSNGNSQTSHRSTDLADRLPDYALPDTIQLLEALPKTPNGKTNYRALARMEVQVDAAHTPITAGFFESTIAEVIGGVIGRELDPGMNFFAAGATSLTAMRGVARIRKALEAPIKLQDLFAFPTARQLAAQLQLRRSSVDFPSLTPVEEKDGFVLSDMQERMWFLQQLEGASASYHMTLAIAVDGDLSPDMLQFALNTVVVRHDVLRTVYRENNDRITAHVLSDDVRLTTLTPCNELSAVLAAFYEKPFDLSTEPPVRVAVQQRGDCEWVIAFCLHHIASDLWSLQALVNELIEAYVACRDDQPLAGRAPLQYQDFAAWSRKWRESEDYQRQIEYWKDRLAGAPGKHNLPTDRPRPARLSNCGAVHREGFPAHLMACVREQCNGQGVTLFMYLQTAFACLLSRLSGERDVVMGTPIANRFFEEIQQMQGCFVNTLVLRHDMAPDRSFGELLQQNKCDILRAFDHSLVPFEALVEELQPARDLSSNPLFQIMFSLNTENVSRVADDTFHFRRLPHPEAHAKFDLTLTVNDSAEVTELAWEFNRDLFDATTIARFSAAFFRLLAEAVANEETALQWLPALSAAREAKLLEASKGRQIQGVAESWQSRFRAMAEQFPQTIAGICGDVSVTYQSLYRNAVQLARHLREKGLQTEQVVAVCGERSIGYLTAIAGILLAGGCYMPLPANTPESRRRLLLESSRAFAVLAVDEEAGARCSDRGNQPQTLMLADLLASEAPCAGLPDEEQQQLAYVMFTSGSTGTPKGTLNTFRGAVNHLIGLQEVLDIGTGTRIAQNVATSFDVHVWQFMGPLYFGGTVVIYPDDIAFSPDKLAQALVTDDVALLEAVPSLLVPLLDELVRQEASLPALRHLMPTGEILPVSLCEAWQEAYPDVAIINAYGPAECADDVSLHRVCGDDAVCGVIPVGRPIANTRLHVLDSNLMPVDIGCLGEICVGGAAVGRGYLNASALTAEAFVPDPFADEPGARLYRTGDLGYLTVDGSIVVSGRSDYQLKIRGQRIEPAEIETRIMAFDDIRAALVGKFVGDDGAEHLVAWVVSSDPTLCEQIRSALREQLPPYMVPTLYVPLARMPLTANGKIDRAALPPPEVNNVDSEMPLSTRTENMLATLWQRVLKCERVSANSDFFALGGHSLLATRVTSALRQEHGIDVPLSVFWERPELSAMARYIDEHAEPTRKAALIPAAPRGTALPLSHAQRRLWFLDKFSVCGGTPEYNMPAALTLSGALDMKALSEAWGLLISRHEPLRTRFTEVNGEPRQIIDPTPETAHVEAIDAGRFAGVDDRAIHGFIVEWAEQPFCLASEWCARLALISLSARQHVLLFNMHHIVSDGWSIEILIREFCAAYQAIADGRLPGFAPLPIQFADYATWQAGEAQRHGFESDLAYWREALEGIPEVHNLPLDHPRPAEQTFRGARVPQRLSGELTAAFRKLCWRQGSSVFMGLMTAFSLLVARWSDSDDVVVGSPIAGRNRAELEGLVGCFANTLAYRTCVPTGADFASLLEASRSFALKAQEHQDIPFETLVDALNPSRNMAYSPIFQVMFVLQNHEKSSFELPGVIAEGLRFDRTIAKFDLILHAEELDDGFDLAWEYNTALFDASTIERMARGFEVLLSGIVASPHTPIERLPVQAPEDAFFEVQHWNDTHRDYSRNACIHDSFEQQAQAAPGRIALVCGEGQWTYGELDARANQLAHYLLNNGVSPGDIVPVSLPRTFDMVTAVLAVLKAGAAYVPLDPAFPADRKCLIIEDTQARLVLAHTDTAGSLEGGNVRVVAIDTLDLSALPATPTGVRVGSSALAYIIFTSGSTGKPKGVVLQHAPVVNTLEWINRTYAVGPDDRILFITSLSFDLSVYDIFGGLAAGASVLIAQEEDLRDPTRLIELIETRHVTFWDSAPAALMQLVPFLPERGSEHLRLVFLSGDWIPLSLPPALQRCYEKVRVVGLGGATEAAIWSNHFSVGEIAPHWRSIPYGLPIQNARYYVLDSQLNPCPHGTPGDLYIGGECVAFGYFGQPELTAQRYLPDPYSPRPGGIMYATGDRARRMPDGNLEFLGRLDNQVKLRGYRIELGEIELVLGRCDGVKEAVACVREHNGSQLLVAYLQKDENVEPVPAEVANTARQKLPEYMVPQHFVLVDEWPVTANGKLDRKALPAPEIGSGGIIEFEAPVGELEEAIAQLWQRHLQLDKVGRNDNFFSLGGHSLLAVQIVADLRAELQLEVAVRSLFEAPSVAQFATSIAAQGNHSSSHVTIERVSRLGRLPVTFAQQRLWFLDAMEGPSPAYNMPWSIRISGPLHLERFEQSLRAVIERHEVFSLRFESVNGVPFALAHGHDFKLQKIDARSYDECTLEKMRRDHANATFDLRHGPLVRAMLLQTGEAESELLLNIHHIICDGWSIGILIDDFARIYQGGESGLPRLPFGYVDYAQWLNQEKTSERFSASVDRWVERLSDFPTSLDLKPDYPMPTHRHYSGKTIRFAICDEVGSSIRQLAESCGATLYMTLLSVFSIALYGRAGQSRFMVGSPVAGRTIAGLESLVGFFVNNLVIPCEIEPNTRFTDLLKQMRETVLSAFDHQQVPFDMLVDKLNVDRNSGRAPLVQALFALQNMPIEDANFGDLEFELIEQDYGNALFDLALGIMETEQGLKGGIQFSTELFKEESVERFIQRFMSILAVVAADPDCTMELLCRSHGNLSALQTTMWMGQEYYAKHNLYNLQAFFDIKGPIDVDLYRQACAALIEDSEVLRMGITNDVQGMPNNTLVAQPKPAYTDFSHEADTEAALRNWSASERQRVIALHEGASITLIRMAEDRFLWSLRIHHLFADGITFGLIYFQFCRYYEQLLAGEAITREPQSHNAVLREHTQYQEKKQFAKAVAYWRELLAEPVERHRFYGAREARGIGPLVCRRQALSADLSSALEATGNVHDAMLANLLIYLHKLSGRTRLSVGVVIHNRTSRALKQAQGLIMQTVPLVIDVAPTDSLNSLSEKVKRGMMRTARYSRYGIPAVQSEQHLDVLFNRHTNHVPTLDGHEVTVDWLPPATQHASLALQLHAFGSDQRYSLDFDFRADLFDEERQQLTQTHFFHILQQSLTRPNASVASLQLLPDEEQGRMLTEFSAGKRFGTAIVGFDSESCFVRSVYAQLAGRGQARAVSCDRETLTYADLWRRASLIARQLKGANIGQGDIVPLLAERGCQLIAAILGTMMVGAAYMPLNPEHPRRRHRKLIEASQATVLLHDEKHENAALQLYVQDRFNIEGSPDGMSLSLSWPVEATPHYPDAPAYVMFTSGSTGTPKGAVVSHRGFMNHALGMTDAFDLGQNDIVAQNAPQSFDVSVWQMLVPLLVGAHIRVIGNDEAMNPEALAHCVRDDRITILELVPSVLAALLDTFAEDRPLGSLRWLIPTGEALPATLIERWFVAYPEIPVANAYGPAECADDVTLMPLRSATGGEAGSIGYPMIGARILVLDAYFELTPPGVTGDIYVAGECVGLGYLGDVIRTSESFLPDPFAADGSRMYRTGDRGYFSASGELVFAGRDDAQVKLRGQRLELGEIESHLEQNPAVQQCAVKPTADGNHLAAYVVASKVALDTTDLRQFLAGRLPPYMVPEFYTVLNALPLNANGKIDRKALPEPLSTRTRINSEPPQSDTERQLAGLWSRLLGAQEFGRHDDFFQCGGHSLLAAQLGARIRDCFAVEVSLRTLFESSTLATMAVQIEEAAPIAACLLPVDRSGALPASFAQQRLWFLDNVAGGDSSYNIAGAFFVSGVLNEQALRDALSFLMTRHEPLRTALVAEDGNVLQIIHDVPLVPLEWYGGVLTESACREQLLQMKQQPFNLSEPPLWRITINRLETERFWINLVIHHAISDAWSMSVFVQEIGVVYSSFVAGKAPEMAPLSLQYADYAAWQRERLDEQTLGGKLAYWHEQLADAPPVHNLPLDFERPQEASTEGAEISFTIDEETSSQLQALCNQSGCTLYMAMLGAFATLVSRMSGRDDIVIGSSMGERPDPALERAIGFFVNTVAMRLRLAECRTFNEVLHVARQTTLDAAQHQDVPFDSIVSHLNRTRYPNINPVFQLFFVLHNTPSSDAELPDMKIEPVQLEEQASMFDLTLAMRAEGDGLSGSLTYSRILFREDSIQAMISRFQRLLKEVTRAPETPIASIELGGAVALPSIRRARRR